MTEFLEGTTPINVIPDYVQNFAEASMYVMESVNDDFFGVLESAGFVSEDGAITEDTEVVTEGVKELGDKFIAALKKMWGTIQGWFEKVSKWFDEQATNFKEHVKSMIEGAKGKTIGKINAAMLDGVNDKIRVGTYTNYAIDISKIQKAYKAVSDGVNMIKNSATDSENPLFEMNEQMNLIVDNLGGKTAKEISDKVKNDFVREENKNATIGDVKKDFDNIAKVVFGNDKKVLKAAYTTAKKSIDQSIKKINEMKTWKFKKDSEQKFMNKAIAKAAGFCKTANQCLHAYHSAVVGVLRARFSQYAHIVVVCTKAAIKAKVAKKITKESVEEAPETSEVTLESLFEW